MKKDLIIFLAVLAAIFAVFAVSCKKQSTIPLTADDITNKTGPAGTPTMTPTAIVVPAGFIDDCNDGDNASETTWATGEAGVTGPGFWYSYNDWASTGSGTTGNSYVVPLAVTECATYDPLNPDCGKFYMQAPGYDGTGYCARITGYTTNSYIYGGAVGMGVNLIGTLPSAACGTPGPASLDISAYTGIKFWAKGDGVTSYIIKIPYSDDCNNSLVNYDDYSFTFTPTATWSLITEPFTSFTRPGYSGTTLTLATALQNARAIQWSAVANTGAQAAVDLSIDNIQLY